MLDLGHLGLDPEDVRTFLRDLAFSHDVRVRVDLLDHDESPIGSWSGTDRSAATGTIQYDDGWRPPGQRAGGRDQAVVVSRRLQVTLADPKGKIVLDPESPSELAVDPGFFVAVEQDHYSPTLGKWIPCPVFWGPLTDLSRAGEQVTVEGMGKEVLGLDPGFLAETVTVDHATTVPDGIAQIMGEVGETRFAMPELPKSGIPHDYSLPRLKEAWRGALHLAGSIHHQVFYDGLGRLRLRERPVHPVFTFRGQDLNQDDILNPATLLGDPEVTFDETQLRNAVAVEGENPKSPGKTHPKGWAVLPAEHPLSPQSLARHGKPRYMIEVIRNPQTKKASDAQDQAERHLRLLSQAQTSANFTALANPLLEPGDVALLVARVGRNVQHLEFVLHQWTLDVGGVSMQVGEVGRRHRQRGHRGHHRHHGGKA